MSGRRHGYEVDLAFVRHAQDRLNHRAFKAFDLFGNRRCIERIQRCLGDVHQLEGIGRHACCREQ